jgi:hypothetical protein
MGFDECPRRWALARTEIPCFGGTVSPKPGRSGVEGTLLHALIEQFAHHATQEGAEIFRPRRTLLEEVAKWAKENANNPRIDSKALAGQVRIEEILRAFAEACIHVKRPVRHPTSAASPGGATRALEGYEVWLRDPESKLCGRADLIAAGEIVDFKSGEQQDHHAKQLAFYGALHLALTGRRPAALRLIYTGTNEAQEVSVPSLNELELLLMEMRQQVATADREVVKREFPAKPDPTRCMYCHVRVLCDSYLKKLVDEAQNGIADQGALVDYCPTAAARIETAALGIYIRDSWSGLPSVLHLPKEVADKIGDDARRLRVLALRANTSPEGVRFAFTQSSEIYIVSSPRKQ